jgi:hypothetical protein
MKHKPCQRVSTLHLHLTRPIARRGTLLLDQQLWCWGCDVRKEGNLLIHYGFERHAPPPHQHESSLYYRPLLNAQSIHLWGFGILWHDVQGDLFLRRYDFAPSRLQPAMLPLAAWNVAQLPQETSPLPYIHQIRQQLALLCNWIADYEDWLHTMMSTSYRQTCVKGWVKAKSAVAASQMADSWRRLGDDIYDSLGIDHQTKI